MAVLRTITETRAYATSDSWSAKLWERAQGVLPGGNSRTTVYMAPRPIYAAEGEGCWISGSGTTAPRACSTSGRTSRAWARSSAAAFRSAPSAVGPR